MVSGCSTLVQFQSVHEIRALHYNQIKSRFTLITKTIIVYFIVYAFGAITYCIIEFGVIAFGCSSGSIWLNGIWHNGIWLNGNLAYCLQALLTFHYYKVTESLVT